MFHSRFISLAKKSGLRNLTKSCTTKNFSLPTTLTNLKFWYALLVDVEVRYLRNKELEVEEYRVIDFEIKSY